MRPDYLRIIRKRRERGERGRRGKCECVATGCSPATARICGPAFFYLKRDGATLRRWTPPKVGRFFHIRCDVPDRAATRRLIGCPAMSSDAEAGSGVNAEPSSRGSSVGFALVILVAFFIFGATFRTGIHYGMDQKVGWEAWGRVLQAISAVMTAERYGEGGYALSDYISSELYARGFNGDDPEVVQKFGMKVPENFQASFLDDVLQRNLGDLPNIS